MPRACFKFALVAAVVALAVEARPVRTGGSSRDQALSLFRFQGPPVLAVLSFKCFDPGNRRCGSPAVLDHEVTE